MTSPGRESWRDYRLLIGGSAVMWLLVLTGIWVGYRHLGPLRAIWPLLTGGALELPRDLAAAGVVHGAGSLAKKRWLQQPGLGDVTAISIRPEGARRGDAVSVVGNRGAVLADAAGRVMEQVSFGQPRSRTCLDRVEPIRGRDGEPIGFLSRGSWACPAARLDARGRVLWRYGGSAGVDDATAGDLDGDGRMDFVVGFNGGGGLHRVDDQGRAVWIRSDGNVWRVALVATKRDGPLRIAHTNSEGVLTIRDDAGRVIHRVAPPIYLSHFSLVSWPGRETPALLQMEDERLWVIDTAGVSIVSLSAPRGKGALDAHGTPVRLKTDRPEFFAVVATYGPWRRSTLHVYTPGRELVYAEVLADACAGIAALPGPGDRPDALLVGCHDLVWRYDPD